MIDDGDATEGRSEMVKWIVFTDLDGTLLDHETYRFDAAKPALDRLKREKIPLILNTSKTMAEVFQIREALGNRDPFIVENGSLIVVPENYFESDDGLGESFEQTNVTGYRIERLGGKRDEIVSLLAKIRQEMGVKFTGFADMTLSDLVTFTGLSQETAALAKDRLATEPILWQDSDKAFHKFTVRLEKHGLQWVQGGRFISISEPFDKRDGVRRLVSLYRNAFGQRKDDANLHDRNMVSPDHENDRGILTKKNESDVNGRLITVALGDSPNDQGMLDSVDVAVIIRSDRSEKIALHHPKRVIRTTRRGPEGWQEAMDRIIP